VASLVIAGSGTRLPLSFGSLGSYMTCMDMTCKARTTANCPRIGRVALGRHAAFPSECANSREMCKRLHTSDESRNRVGLVEWRG
jgi:hypothetical protein